MVDFSIFFLSIRYILLFVQDNITDQTMPYIFMMVGGTLLLGLIGWLINRKKPVGVLAFIGKGTRRLSILLGSVCGLIGLLIVRPMIVDWVVVTFDIDGALFEFVTISILLGLFAVGTIVASRFFTKEPNNNSLLNTRQLFTFLSVCGFIVLGLYVLGNVNGVAFRIFLTTLFLIAECLSILFWFYDPFIYILSQVVKGRKKPPCEPTPEKLNRFAVIGCAHNEETVISELIKSLYATTYPKNHYTVYIMCDNCSDGTANVVRKEGAIAMERNDPDHRGKGFGLKWMFEFLAKERENGNEYDAYIVLDADNLVNEAFLDAINDKMNEGYEILQTYLGCKNPGDTWVSASYSYAYWVSNSIYQRAHSEVGLSAQMGGTGMIIRPKVLDEIGWDTDSLTEDLVLTSRYILKKNLACCWVHDAKLYDEKPLKVVPSIRQRTRWMQGHIAAMFKFAPKLVFSGIIHGSLKQLDMAFYLARPFLNLMMFATYLVHILANLVMPQHFLSTAFIMSPNASQLLLIGSFALQFYVLFREYHVKYLFSAVYQIVFSYTWYPAILRGLLKHKERYWVSTVHTRNIAIDDVKEDVLLQEAKERLKGLDNIHKLPLGQILLKATAITKQSLDMALEYQAKHGGFLGDIIVDMKAMSKETLDAYLSIQQNMKETAAKEGDDDKRILLGDILIGAGLITESQLEMVLAYQKKHGGYLGECLIAMQCLPIELLSVFLEVQNLLDANYVSLRNSHILIEGALKNQAENIGMILYNCGLISNQQIKVTLEEQQETGEQVGAILVKRGFISEKTLEIILKLQTSGRAFLKSKQAGFEQSDAAEDSGEKELVGE